MLPINKSTLRSRKQRELQRIYKRIKLTVNDDSSQNSESEVSDVDSLAAHDNNNRDEDDVYNRQFDNENNSDWEPQSPNSSMSDDSIEDDRAFREGDEQSADDDHESLPSSDEDQDMNNVNEGIDEIRRWAVNCRIKQTHLDQLLTILKQRFAPTIPKCAKTFLRTNAAVYDIVPMQDHDNSYGEFTYLGIEEGLLTCVNSRAHERNILPLIFNIDGIKFFKSSAKTAWPILCCIYSDPDIYEPFSVAIYSGNSKPKNLLEYLSQFIIELNELCRTGININNRHFHITIKCFICDTPARSYLKCVKGHNATHGCERCTVIGRKINSTMVYAGLDHTARTDNDFRQFMYLLHQTTIVSPFQEIEPNIDMISDWLLDAMHLLYLGVMKRLLETWLDEFDVRQKNELNRLIEMIKKDIPKEYVRKIRSLHLIRKYKAVDFKFFLLVCGPIVMKRILTPVKYKHFLLLHVACRLLCSKNALNYTRQAKQFLNEFISDSGELYHPEFVVMNVHNLTHLADDVERMGCNLNQLNCFKFESHLGKIKNFIHSPHRVLAQYCRRLHEQQLTRVPPQLPSNIEIIKQNEQNIITVLKLRGQYISTSAPDNTVLINERTILEVLEILTYENIIHFRGAKQEIRGLLYNHPCDSNELKTWELKTNIPRRIVTVPIIMLKLN